MYVFLEFYACNALIAAQLPAQHCHALPQRRMLLGPWQHIRSNHTKSMMQLAYE